MSSNKIGFFTALGLYTPIVVAIMMFNQTPIIIGESGTSKAFSIRLENIAGTNKTKDSPKPSQKRAIPKNAINTANPAKQSTKIASQISQDSQNKAESKADSSALKAVSNVSSEAKAQSATGENDPYLIAIINIINKYHAREPLSNLYGAVGVAFSINLQGEIEHLTITSSSGNARLDNIALKTIRRAANAFPKPAKAYYVKTRLVYKRS